MFRSQSLRAALGAVALGGALLAWSGPASAGAGTGSWRNGMVAGPYGVGFYGGYRPAFHGYRPHAYHRPYYRRNNTGAAVAAGLIGGLAIGALATAPYRYSYPVSYGGYYGASYYDAPTCYSVRRRFVDAWGRVVTRRTDVCE